MKETTSFIAGEPREIQWEKIIQGTLSHPWHLAHYFNIIFLCHCW